MRANPDTSQKPKERLFGCDLRGGKPSFPATPMDADSDVALDILITNVVCVFRTRCHLNLRKIALEGANVIYKRDVGESVVDLAACTVSYGPRCRLTRVTGGLLSLNRSEEEAKFGARRLARSLQKLGFQVIFTDFKVVNVLAVCNMPFEIRLPEFTKNNRPHASYEPELHPAVCYRIKSLRATLQIFSTGSITVTGPNVKAVATAVEQIYPFVFESRKEIL
nr:PREDICTED: TATA box-binding protein-like protein 1 isoform X1 [Equus przewalskii]